MCVYAYMSSFFSVVVSSSVLVTSFVCWHRFCWHRALAFQALCAVKTCARCIMPRYQVASFSPWRLASLVDFVVIVSSFLAWCVFECSVSCSTSVFSFQMCALEAIRSVYQSARYQPGHRAVSLPWRFPSRFGHYPLFQTLALKYLLRLASLIKFTFTVLKTFASAKNPPPSL